MFRLFFFGIRLPGTSITITLRPSSHTSANRRGSSALGVDSELEIFTLSEEGVECSVRITAHLREEREAVLQEIQGVFVMFVKARY